MRNRFERGANDMLAPRPQRQPEDRALRVGPPVWRAEPGERRHDRHAAIVVRPRQRLGLARMADPAEPVAQPLDHAAGHEHRALERIGALSANLAQYRRQQAVARSAWLAPGGGQDEGAGAKRGLGRADLAAALADRRRLLVPRQPADRDRRAQPGRIAGGDRTSHVDHSRQTGVRDPEQVAQPRVEARAFERQQQGAAGVARVADMRAARQLPHQPAFDRAEREARPGRGDFGHMVDHPAPLGRGEIGVQHQPGRGADGRLVASFPERGTGVGSAAILPHDRARQRLAA